MVVGKSRLQAPHALAAPSKVATRAVTDPLDGVAREQMARDGFKLVINKGARQLEVRSLSQEGELLRRYRAGLGFSPEGDKQKQGDGKTPEGTFTVTGHVPWSSFYKAFLISYPMPEDADRGLATGLITKAEADRIKAAHRPGAPPPHDTALGGLIEIHGGCGSADWTLGCVAICDDEIDELWKLVAVGTVVEVRP